MNQTAGRTGSKELNRLRTGIQMLTWDIEAVAAFLWTEAVHEDNSSYRFSFAMLGGVASLQVFPYSDEVILTVDIAGRSDAATWQLDCSAIEFNDEIPEEGGPCLVFVPASHPPPRTPPTHWVVLGRNGDVFEILTVFHDLTI